MYFQNINIQINKNENNKYLDFLLVSNIQKVFFNNQEFMNQFQTNGYDDDAGGDERDAYIKKRKKKKEKNNEKEIKLIRKIKIDRKEKQEKQKQAEKKNKIIKINQY
ncbi:hypothetical protein ABPG74_021720 [Tetrahymena malaccensis]